MDFIFCAVGTEVSCTVGTNINFKCSNYGLRRYLLVSHRKGTGSIPVQSMWDGCLIDCHWETPLSEYFDLPPSVILYRAQLTYLLTTWSRVLLEKLTGSAVSQEIPRIFGTRRFLTVPTSARHLFLS